MPHRCTLMGQVPIETKPQRSSGSNSQAHDLLGSRLQGELGLEGVGRVEVGKLEDAHPLGFVLKQLLLNLDPQAWPFQSISMIISFGQDLLLEYQNLPSLQSGYTLRDPLGHWIIFGQILQVFIDLYN